MIYFLYAIITNCTPTLFKNQFTALNIAIKRFSIIYFFLSNNTNKKIFKKLLKKLTLSEYMGHSAHDLNILAFDSNLTFYSDLLDLTSPFHKVFFREETSLFCVFSFPETDAIETVQTRVTHVFILRVDTLINNE